MSEVKLRLFSFTDLRDGTLVYEKSIGEPFFQIQIPGVGVSIVPLSAKAKAAERYSSQISEAEEHKLVRLKVRQLIGVKMNFTLQLLKIINTRGASEVSKLARNSLYNQFQTNLVVSLAYAERQLLISRLDQVFNEWADEVMQKTTSAEVETFFRNLKETVVIGPFAAANILDEKVDS
jgi:hypothetical protein